MQRTQAKYRILAKDTYNFNKASFAIGQILPYLVITSTERRSQRKALQLGNCKQATVIQGINAASQAILLFLILVATYYNSAQYSNNNILANQKIAVSNSSQSNNNYALRQLRHFIKHIDKRKVGARRLLLFNSYSSYKLAKFNKLCKENNIYMLYMLLYLLHLLQLLDISYFLLLKRAYSYKIKSLMHSYINYITKLEFLLAFRAVFYKAFTENNICAKFRATRLALFNLNIVLLKLNIVVSILLLTIEQPT